MMDIIKSKKIPEFLLYGIAITMSIDILLTYLILTSVIGSKEKNPMAYYFMQMFGIIPGLIILSLLTIILLSVLGTILKKLIQKIVKTEKVDSIAIANGIWITLLLFFFMKSLKAIANNLLILLVSV